MNIRLNRNTKTGIIVFGILTLLVGSMVAVAGAEPPSPESSRFGSNAIVAGFRDETSVSGYSPGPIEAQEKVIKGLNEIGIGWGRWMGRYDVSRGQIEQPSGYNFEKSDRLTEAAFRHKMALIGHLSNLHEFGLPGFGPLEDREAFMNYVRATVERYDGDADLGLPENHPSYPNCDLNDDGEVTNEEKAEWGRTHRFHCWQTMKEPVPSYGRPGFSPVMRVVKVKDVVDILQASWEAIREVDPDTPILFAVIGVGLADGEANMKRYFKEILQAGSGKYFDIVGVSGFGDNVNVEVELHREVLQELGLNKSIWVVQYGTNAVDTSRKVKVNTKGGSVEKQAAWVVKAAVVSFATGADKVFWSDFMYAVDEEDTLNYWANYGLLHMDGVQKRPGGYTYGLTISKIDRFSSVRKVDDGQYMFEFPSKKPVFVLWKENGEETVDLSTQIKTSEVMVTHIIDKVGQTVPRTERVSANAVPVSEKPIFVEPAED